MLGKTLILGLISASAAGGIVYYGTSPQGSEALEATSNDGIKAETSLKKVESAVKKGENSLKKGEIDAKKGDMSAKKDRERIEPRLPTVRSSGIDDKREKLASAGGLPVSENADMPPAATETAEAKPQKQTRWLDQYLKNNKSETSATEAEVAGEAEPEAEVDADVATDGPGFGSATNSFTVTKREATNVEPSTDGSVTDARTFRIENGKLVEITDNEQGVNLDDMIETEEGPEASVMPEKIKSDDIGEPHKLSWDKADMASDTTPLLSTVMNEAAAITKPKLRDQAYFEITEFALSEGRFNSARLAHDMIMQDELIYTAKSRIAVAYAQNGQPSKAFKVIGEVDESELRDFMRLQVIEALIAPQNLPQAWQEKAN